jgi:hypothetical protein
VRTGSTAGPEGSMVVELDVVHYWAGGLDTVWSLSCPTCVQMYKLLPHRQILTTRAAGD